MVAEIERAAAMREPAHDHAIAADHLLAVDAEVLARLCGSASDREAPGNQRTGVPRPAGLHGQAREIDVVPFHDNLMARGRRHFLRCHVEHLPEHRKLVPEIAQPLRRLGLLEVGKQLADFAQRRGILDAHREGDAPYGAEEIAEHRNVVPAGFSKRSAGPPARSTRSQTSVISRRGETLAVTRFNSPFDSSWERNSRRSE